MIALMHAGSRANHSPESGPNAPVSEDGAAFRAEQRLCPNPRQRA